MRHISATITSAVLASLKQIRECFSPNSLKQPQENSDATTQAIRRMLEDANRFIDEHLSPRKSPEPDVLITPEEQLYAATHPDEKDPYEVEFELDEAARRAEQHIQNPNETAALYASLRARKQSLEID